MTIEDSIKWIESKAEEQEKLGNILEAEDYMQVAEYLRDLKSGLDNDGDTLGNLLKQGHLLVGEAVVHEEGPVSLRRGSGPVPAAGKGRQGEQGV